MAREPSGQDSRRAPAVLEADAVTERRSAGSRLRASLRSHHVALGLGLGLVGVALAVRSAPGASGPRALEPLLARARVALPSAPLDPAEPESPTFDDRPLRLPSGLPAALPCEGARAIVAQVRGSLAMPPSPVEPQAFAEALADWLDPHGLWSVAPDAPLSAELRREAPALLAELEARPGSGPCRAFGRSGAALETWVTGLRTTFDTAYARTHSAVGRTSPTLGFERASFAPFEDGAVTKKASWLAAELGRATGVGLCVGAALDFLSGRAERAPVWMRRAGFEWLHRLVSEPGRLWKRYLVTGPKVFSLFSEWRAAMAAATSA